MPVMFLRHQADALVIVERATYECGFLDGEAVPVFLVVKSAVH